jgi:hypothetical protein
LDCSEYKNLEYIFISASVDSSKLEIKNGSYNLGNEIRKTKIIPCRPTHAYLNQEYPTQKEREEIKELDISYKALEGNCDLSDFKNCEELYC